MRASGVIPGLVREIGYQRSGTMRGPYKHIFTTPVRMHALADGSVFLRGRQRIWADDREPGFEQYYDNPGRCRYCGVNLRAIREGRALHAGDCPLARRRNPMRRSAPARRRRAPASGGSSTLLWVGLGVAALWLLASHPQALPPGLRQFLGRARGAGQPGQPGLQPEVDLGQVAGLTAITAGIPALTRGFTELIHDAFHSQRNSEAPLTTVGPVDDSGQPLPVGSVFDEARIFPTDLTAINSGLQDVALGTSIPVGMTDPGFSLAF